MGYPHIIVTGDSIAQGSFAPGGYGAALAQRYAGKADVLNRGMGGYNSHQLLLKLRSDLLPAGVHPLLFVVHIGTNDSALDGSQTVLVNDYRTNLTSIVGELKSSYPAAAIVLLTPSTLNVAVTRAAEDSMDLPEDLRHYRQPDNTKHYVNACVGVGEGAGVPVINVFDLHEAAVAVGDKLEDLFSDGLHFTAKGYEIVTRALLKTIDSRYPDLRPLKMSEAFPAFFSYTHDTEPEGSKGQRANAIFTRLRAMYEAEALAEEEAKEAAATKGG